MKNAYYNNKPRTLLQKFREAIGAIIIESRYSKDEILQKYLSTVYMGNGLYGIETVTGDSPDNDIILDTITRFKFPNITASNSDNVLLYRTTISNKLDLTSSRTRLFESKKRNSINLYPIITTRVDREVSLYCRGQENTLKQWINTIPKNLCDTSEVNLTLTIDSVLMDTVQSISQ